MHFTPPPVQAAGDTGPNIRLSQHRKQPLSTTEPGRVCCLPTAKLHLTCLHRGTNSTLATKPGTSNLRSMSSNWETRARYLRYRKLLIIPPSSSMSTEPPGTPLKTSCTFPTRLALPHSPSHAFIVTASLYLRNFLHKDDISPQISWKLAAHGLVSPS